MMDNKEKITKKVNRRINKLAPIGKKVQLSIEEQHDLLYNLAMRSILKND